jgi:hypothetical protein
MGAGIIGRNNYEAAFDTGVSGAEERIGSDVKTDLLHRHC